MERPRTRHVDGISEHAETYDEHGRLAVAEFDFDGDGVIDARETHAYDADGSLTLVERDDGADGTVDRRQVMAYDGPGRQTSFEEDMGADGTVDLRFVTAYDGDGNVDFLAITTYEASAGWAAAVSEHGGR